MKFDINYAPPGFLAVPAVKECVGCHFEFLHRSLCPTDDKTGKKFPLYCYSGCREDKTEAILIKQKKQG